jgi:hypothetical protein
MVARACNACGSIYRRALDARRPDIGTNLWKLDKNESYIAVDGEGLLIVIEDDHYSESMSIGDAQALAIAILRRWPTEAQS